MAGVLEAASLGALGAPTRFDILGSALGVACQGAGAALGGVGIASHEAPDRAHASSVEPFSTTAETSHIVAAECESRGEAASAATDTTVDDAVQADLFGDPAASCSLSVTASAEPQQIQEEAKLQALPGTLVNGADLKGTAAPEPIDDAEGVPWASSFCTPT